MDNYGTFVNNYEKYDSDHEGMEYRLGRLPALNALGDIAGKRVLDFGCGPGTNGNELAQRGARVTGIDVSEEELHVARRRDSRGEYLHYDGIHLAGALQDQQVGGILASFSMCTIPDAPLKVLLHDMRNLLDEGGKLVIVEPNLEKALGTRYHDLYYHAQPNVKSGDHIHVTLGVGEDAIELYHDIYRVHADYLQLLEEAGFKVTTVQQPRPRGWDLLKWWKAVVTPPFVIFVAE